MLRRPFVGIFVVFFIIGWLSVIGEINSPIADRPSTEGRIEGVVFDLVEKANTTQIHLKDGIFRDEEQNKIYHVGNVIVYYSKYSSNSNYSSYYNSNDLSDFNHKNSNKNQNNNPIFKQNENQNSEQTAKDSVSIGNRVSLEGTLENFSTPRNLGQFNEAFYYRSRNYYYKFFGKELEIVDPDYNVLMESLRKLRAAFVKVYDANLSDREAGMVKAMVLGEKSGMDQEVKELYQQNGIGHLIAISGLHITMVAGGFYKVLELIGSPKKCSSLLTMVFIWLYGLLTGFGVSTNRAVVMMMLSLIAGVVGRTYDMLTALSISGIVILAQKPMLCADSGFLLSFGAILGIGIANPILVKGLELEKTSEEKLREKKSKNNKSAFIKFKDAIQETLKKSLLASLSVQIVTLPIILSSYYEIPPYGVLLNLIVIPLMSILLGTALVGGIVGIIFPFIPFLSRFLMGSVHIVLSWYETLGILVRKLPFSRLIIGKPEIWQITIYYILLVCLLYVFYTMKEMEEGRKAGDLLNKIGSKEWKRTWKKIWEIIWSVWIKLTKGKKRLITVIWLAISFLCLIPVENWKFMRTELEFNFVDVGQGDCIFIRNKSGFTCLVDGGSTDEKNVGTYRIIPFLKAKGIGRIDYVMVSHTDSDHISGIIELMEDSQKGGVEIGRLVLPQIQMIEENYENLVNLAKECEIPVGYIKTGDKLRVGQLELTCLHPAKDYKSEDINSYSTVLEVKYGAFKALLTGDLGIEEEKHLLENGMLEDVLLLKVGHHGSKNSSCEEFLECIKPELSIISAGKDNSYGHPHSDTLERLAKAGSKVVSTIDYGEITVKVEGGRVRVEGYVR